jgi:hypothetical protein
MDKWDYTTNIDEAAAFRELYLCEPMPVERLVELANEYHRRCEEYDRSVCTGPIVNGAIMPATYREMGLINRNAGAVLREVMWRAEVAGFTPRQIRETICKLA